MSGFEKWSRRESALCRFKNFLLQERPVTRESINNTNGFNDIVTLDLDQSFKNMLKTNKAKQATAQNKENIYKPTSDNANNLNGSGSSMKTASEATMYSLNDTTILEEAQIDSDDDCFEELERMCNKTLSDPNNTIHTFLANRKLRKAGASRLQNKTIAGDQTQLGDIEAPSCLWENTISEDVSILELSLDKPLPVIAEDAGNILDETLRAPVSTNAEKTALSEQYITGVESLRDLTKSENSSDPNIGEPVNSQTDCYVTAFETFSAVSNFENNISCETTEEEIVLIDLDSSFPSKGAIPKRTSDSTSDLVTLTTKEESNLKKNNAIDLIDLEGSLHVSNRTNAEDNSIILLTDEEDDTAVDNDTIVGNDSHNTAFSIDLDDSREISTAELSQNEFDNTLDEVDYIMRQGMKYLEQNQMLPKFLHTPSPLSSPQTPNTIIKKTITKLSPTEHDKYGTFKKPQIFSRIPQCKTNLVAKKPPHFEHIISPVGAYIKNTPKVPMTADFKPTLNVFQSKAVRGLDYNMKATRKDDAAREIVASSLPKKAYISSEAQRVVDQRRPIVIPGGDKIHKYLQSAKVPSVIRHEGKIKLYSSSSQQRKADVKVNNSLADLSTISGDVSLHVLRDAKR